MHRIRNNKRAISPIIATLLLVAIAVAAAIVTYSWTLSMVANNSQQAQTGIKIDIVRFTSTSVNATVRNTGSTAATIETIYIYQGEVYVAEHTFTSSNILDPGDTGPFELTTPALSANTPYRVRVITSTGFMAEGTYFTPGSL